MEKFQKIVLTVLILGFALLSFQLYQQNKALKKLEVKVEAISELLFRVV